MRRRKPDPITKRGGHPEALALWPHQERAIQNALREKVRLWHYGMRTGKTRCAIETLERAGKRRALVLAPLSVAGVWPLQLDRWAQREWACAVLDDRCGNGRAKVAQLERVSRLDAPQLIVVNYDAVWREPLASAVRRANFDAVIFDESHRIKAPGGKTAMYVSRMAQAIPMRLLLTGTPMPHGPLDLYGQFRALDQRAFGTSFVRFRARYAMIDARGGFPKIVGFRNQEELAAIAARYTDFADRSVLDLTPATHQKIPITLSPAARAAYDDLEENLSTQVGAGIVTAQNALVALIRLQQLTGGTLPVEDPWGAGSTPTRVDSGKATALQDFLEDLPPHERVVVFCNFTADIAAARASAKAAGRDSLELSGQRHDVRGVWGPGPETVLVCQIKAGGVGVELSSAAYCFFYSLGFSLGDYEQALARVHGSEQKRHVSYDHATARDTVDEVIYGALSKKAQVVETVVEHMKRAQLGETLEVNSMDQLPPDGANIGP